MMTTHVCVKKWHCILYCVHHIQSTICMWTFRPLKMNSCTLVTWNLLSEWLLARRHDAHAQASCVSPFNVQKWELSMVTELRWSCVMCRLEKKPFQRFIHDGIDFNLCDGWAEEGYRISYRFCYAKKCAHHRYGGGRVAMNHCPYPTHQIQCASVITTLIVIACMLIRRFGILQISTRFGWSMSQTLSVSTSKILVWLHCLFHTVTCDRLQHNKLLYFSSLISSRTRTLCECGAYCFIYATINLITNEIVLKYSHWLV